jgi:hypothetical protein
MKTQGSSEFHYYYFMFFFGMLAVIPVSVSVSTSVSKFWHKNSDGINGLKKWSKSAFFQKSNLPVFETLSAL